MGTSIGTCSAGGNFLHEDPIVNAHYIEDGEGRGSWDDASGKWSSIVDQLQEQKSTLSALQARLMPHMQSETGAEYFAKVNEFSQQLDKQIEEAQKYQKAADSVGEAYSTAEGNIVPSEVIRELQAKQQAAAALDAAGGPVGAVKRAIRKVTGGKSAEEMEAELQQIRIQNGTTLDTYASSISDAAESAQGGGEHKQSARSGGGSGAGAGSGSGVAGGGGAAGGAGAVGGGAAGGAGGFAGGGAAGGGSYGTTPYGGGGMSRGGAHPRIGFDKVTADDINLEDYLSKYDPEAGTESPYGTGREVDFGSTRYGGSDYSPSEYTPSEYDPGTYGGSDYESSDYEYSSPDLDTTTSNYTPSDYSSGRGGYGSTPGLTSHSPEARTGLSFSTPNGSLTPTGSGISRFTGAGSLNPGGFRGAGTMGTPGAMTGGLGMMGNSASATPAAAFGGVQPTSAAATASRPPMGMMPMGGGRGGSSSKKQGSQDGSDIRDENNNVLDGINAVGTRRAEPAAKGQSDSQPQPQFRAL